MAAQQTPYPAEEPRAPQREVLHLAVGTVICLATVVLFLVFWARLPDSMPMQIASDGSVNWSLPRPAVAFGMPMVFATLNLVSWARNRDRRSAPWTFYSVPALAVVLSIVALVIALTR